MDKKTKKVELETEVNQRNFLRAVQLATSLELPEEEIRDLQRKAVWQMAAENRNTGGTKKLAQEYGFTKDEVMEIVGKGAQKLRSEGDERILKACYDYSAGKHLTFAAWLDHFSKSWNKPPS